MSDAGGGIDAAAVTLTFADGGPALGSPLTSGSYRPTNRSSGFDAWPSAPAPPHAAALAAFNGSNPNGTWSLYVVDDTDNAEAGAIGGGWCVDIDSVAGTVSTQTAVVSSPNPSQQGAGLTFTATVTGDGGAPVTEGTVAFREGAITLGADELNDQGQATITTDALAAGSHTVTATYNGTAGLAPSSATVTHIVEPTTTTPAEGMWCNTGPIRGPASGSAGVAAPYPSTIVVSGAEPAIGELSVQLAGITTTFPGDLDVLLVGPGGGSVILLSDVGSGADVVRRQAHVRRRRTGRRHSDEYRDLPADEPLYWQRRYGFVRSAGSNAAPRVDVGELRRHRSERHLEPLRRRRFQ